jgi:hypothetical protein
MEHKTHKRHKRNVLFIVLPFVRFVFLLVLVNKPGGLSNYGRMALSL